MKDQFEINTIGAGVDSIKKKKTMVSIVWFIWFFAGLATASLGLVILFWYTSVFQNAILAELKIQNGTNTFSMWKNPPVRPVIRVRIFNYTNVEDYQKKLASKLHVEEVGPYNYRETVTRVNVKIHEDGTISYQEKRTHRLEGNLSEDERIQVPNVPLIAAVSKLKSISSWLHKPAELALNAIGVQPFKSLTVREYIWGYSDELVGPTMKIMSWIESVPYTKFGILMARTGVSKDRITINSGTEDINNVGVYQRFNGEQSRNVWNGGRCNEIGGTDGSLFPPNLIEDRDANLAIYTPEMCRKFPLEFDSYATASDIPSLRYKPTKDAFNFSNTTNSCFCEKNLDDNGEEFHTCPLNGTLDTSACTYGAPLLVSYPHFYTGDKALLNNVDGLNPRRELHETYIDLHPRIGMAMGGWSRIQINAQVTVLEQVSVLGELEDGMILPLIWFELGVDGLPEMVTKLLRKAYYTAGAIESALQWGSLLCTILSMCAMAFMMKKHSEIQRPNKWQNNISLKPGC